MSLYNCIASLPLKTELSYPFRYPISLLAPLRRQSLSEFSLIHEQPQRILQVWCTCFIHCILKLVHHLIEETGRYSREVPMSRKRTRGMVKVESIICQDIKDAYPQCNITEKREKQKCVRRSACVCTILPNRRKLRNMCTSKNPKSIRYSSLFSTMEYSFLGFWSCCSLVSDQKTLKRCRES